MLDITDDDQELAFDPDDPEARTQALYGYLGGLLDEIVDAQLGDAVRASGAPGSGRRPDRRLTRSGVRRATPARWWAAPSCVGQAVAA